MITIHSTTFNRGYIIGKAYESLCRQTCKDFEWIISDDGSTDNTEELVKSWQQKDNGFPIIYSKLSHVGFPRALNDGVSKSNTDWFLMLDSDDYLVPEAIEKVCEWIREIENEEKIVGVGFCRCYPDGRYMKDQLPIIDEGKGYVDAKNTERAKYHLDMDCCEVYRVAILRQFPFQCWPTEQYAPPSLNMNAMAFAGWKVRWHPDKLYICEYLPDGISRNNIKVKRNPMGYAMMYNQFLLIHQSFKKRCEDAIQMTALTIAAGNLSYLRNSNAMGITILTLFVGIVWGIRRIIQFRKMK